MKARRLLKWAAGVIPLLLVVWGLVAYATSDNECSDPPVVAPPHPMKAVTYCDFGPPDVLAIESVETPTPTDDQVLVKVRAAAVNPVDWHTMRGTPYIGRIGMGLRRPTSIRLGVDFAGTIVSAGRNVTEFEPGDEVFGGRNGAFAEYVTVRAAGAVARKPPNVSFEEAAAVPVAAITALQALRDHGALRAGQKVLINGASGGVGTFAVQIAKALGAEVTGVSSARNVALVKSIGADHVIDYTSEDFTKGAQRYDLIVDNVSNHPLSDMRRVLRPGGRYVMVGGPSGRWIDPLPRAFSAIATSWFVKEEMRFFIAQLNKQDLKFLGKLMEAGKVRAVVDRKYPMEEIGEAVRYLETGRARGKVVVMVR